MKVVITGGTGFIGLRLARELLKRGELTAPSGKRERIDEMVLFDVVVPQQRPAGLDERVKIVAGEIADQATVDKLIDTPNIGIFHLASVVSGGAEQDFTLGLNVNLYGHLHLLEAVRRLGTRPRYVFASSLAAFGGKAFYPSVSDLTKNNPQTTYGMTKAVGELLINDYSRKGFIDGRAGRPPAVIVRPGTPNKAASSFVSAVIREPLNGVDYELPVGRDLLVPLMGYRTVVDDFIALYELDGAGLGEDRTVNLPNLAVTVDAMIAATQRVAQERLKGRKLGKVTVVPDEFVIKIVSGWPTGFDATRAEKLGLPKDKSLDAIISAYIEDYLQ